jgi:hypothetical protein
MEEKFDPSKKYARHPKAHPQGGFFLVEAAAKVKDVGLSLLKNLGNKIKEGEFDLLKMSRPAIISYHRTYLECVAHDFHYTKLLNRAAESSDPLERMKWTVAFFLAGFHRNSADMQNNGPLNPVLGETYIAEKKDGTTLFCEQISHHPPVSAFLMIGPKNNYKLYGTGELEVRLNGFSSITGRRIGKNTIEFPDGGKIVFTNPDTKIEGLLVGDRRYNLVKTAVFLDKRNKISAEITFLYEDEGTVTKVTSVFKKFFVGKKEKPFSDEFEVVFFNYDKLPNGELKKDVIFEGTGSWLSHFQVDKKILWRVDDFYDDPWIENMERRLPSDSLFRPDSKYIKAKDFDTAQKEKDALENKQRNDAKLRKEFKEKPQGQ